MRLTAAALSLLLVTAALSSGNAVLAEEAPAPTPEETPDSGDMEGGDDAGEAGEAAVASAGSSPLDDFLADLSSANLTQKAEQYYNPAATYEDPFGRWQGRDALAAHLNALLGSLQTVSLDVTSEFVSGDETVALWTMTFTHSRLHGGEPLEMHGVSHVKLLDGKIISQRDYYDLGIIYENLPFIGRIVRWVKGRITPES